MNIRNKKHCFQLFHIALHKMFLKVQWFEINSKCVHIYAKMDI